MAAALDDMPSGHTKSKNAMSAARYLSPELLLEETSRPTLQSDVWAWGCVFVEVSRIFAIEEKFTNAMVRSWLTERHTPMHEIITM